MIRGRRREAQGGGKKTQWGRWRWTGQMSPWGGKGEEADPRCLWVREEIATCTERWPPSYRRAPPGHHLLDADPWVVVCGTCKTSVGLPLPGYQSGIPKELVPWHLFPWALVLQDWGVGISPSCAYPFSFIKRAPLLHSLYYALRGDSLYQLFDSVETLHLVHWPGHIGLFLNS